MIRTRAPDGAWSAAQTIYEGTGVTPIGINFTGVSDEPLVFVAVESADESRVIALTDDYSAAFWNAETTVQRTGFTEAPSLQSSNLSWTGDSQFRPSANGPNEFGGAPAGFLGIDADGYLYVPGRDFSAITMAPGHQGADSLRYWGQYRKLLQRPTGCAVDNVRGHVYFTRDSTELLHNLASEVIRWDLNKSGGQGNRRDDHHGWVLSGGIPTDPQVFDREYHPAVFGETFRWAGDVSVDEQAGLLYVSDSHRHQIDVFDIENVVAVDTTPFSTVDLFEAGITQQADIDKVEAIVGKMLDPVELAFIDDAGGSTATWIEADLEGTVVADVKGTTEYSQLSDDVVQDNFIRNI